MGKWYAFKHEPGKLAKNKHHVPAKNRKPKTNPHAIKFTYGDRKRNWKVSDKRRFDRVSHV